jgi:hypothetical protein
MDAEFGESGRPRLTDDTYPTPALSSAALIIGLERMAMKFPAVALDPCGRVGQLARIAIALAPGLDVRLSDISPHPEASDLYATMAMVDAMIMADLESMLRITGAKAIFSNFPFKARIYAKIFANTLALLKRGDIELFAVMQRAQRAHDSQIGAVETAHEPRFFGTISCPWRSWLWPKKPGDASPRGSYVWNVYRSTPRTDGFYRVYMVDRDEAETALERAHNRLPPMEAF